MAVASPNGFAVKKVNRIIAVTIANSSTIVIRIYSKNRIRKIILNRVANNKYEVLSTKYEKIRPMFLVPNTFLSFSLFENFA
jgi:hypothetical protein